MRKLILGLMAAAAIAAPIATAGSASAAGASPAHGTGDVAWTWGAYNGTVKFDANVKTGGSLDYVNTFGETLHGVVTKGTYAVQPDGSAQFSGTITGGTDYVEGGANQFSAQIIDGGKSGDKIAVFVNSAPVAGVYADVTGGNLVIH
jgi:hypothetical protein